MTGRVHGLFLLILPAVLFGCGAPSFSHIRDGIVSRGHYVSGVPFFRQTEHACGPAALATVLAYWGRPADLAELTRSVVIPKLGGTLPMDMERAMKELGFRTTTAHGDHDLLDAALKRNVPVICLLDFGIGLVHQPHYVTVIGFDDGNHLFIMHDGATPDRTMTYERFNTAWTRGGQWMLMAEPLAE